jgi:hypothetical protein
VNYVYSINWTHTAKFFAHMDNGVWNCPIIDVLRYQFFRILDPSPSNVIKNALALLTFYGEGCMGPIDRNLINTNIVVVTLINMITHL